MELIRQASSIRADHSASRDIAAHRLRLLEMRGDQDGSGDIQAAQEALRRADAALRETLVMVNALKELIAKVSSETGAAFEEASGLSDSDDGSTDSGCPIAGMSEFLSLYWMTLLIVLHG